MKDSTDLGELTRLYRRLLPLTPMGVCPICGTQLVKLFDPIGPDCAWWETSWKTRYTVEPALCPHFYLLCGALNFNGLPEIGGNTDKVYSGPEIPYLIRTELNIEGRVAVLCEFEMLSGYTAYTIAYFANPPMGIKQGEFPSGWKSDIYYRYDDEGKPSEMVSYGNQTVDWDYDLLPWLRQGKLFWCEPGNNDQLSLAPLEECPFIGRPGFKHSLCLNGNNTEVGFGAIEYW